MRWHDVEETSLFVRSVLCVLILLHIICTHDMER